MSLPRFGVNKPVPVNLLMIGMIVAGIYAGATLRREFFPETDPEAALVSLPYPGATPEEVEETLARKVEDALIDVKEVDEVRATLTEGGGGVTVDFKEGIDSDKAMDEVERAIDSLLDLPEEAETIQVSLLEPTLPVIRVALYGDLDEEVRKRAIRGIRDDLRLLDGMGEIIVDGVRDYEIRVDVDADALIRHGISLPQVSQTIGEWMRDVPGGTVRGGEANVRIRTMGVEEQAKAIRDIVIRSDEEGRAIRVDDIATVRDDFVDDYIYYRHNTQPGAGLTILKSGDQDIVKMAEMVRAYVDARNGKPFEAKGIYERIMTSQLLPEEARRNFQTQMPSSRFTAWKLGSTSAAPLPPGAKIECNFDLARFVEGRLDLLVRNAMYGAVLVFATLLFFLNWRAAMWVGIGLTTALLGTLVLMSYLDITLNLLTMFGLIVVLGLLVDDAIVVSENIQAKHEEGEPALVAAVQGAEQVQWPVVATVLTSIVAFLPLTFIKGQIGTLLGALPMVVAVALAMSLVESLLILPSHMAHSLHSRDRGSSKANRLSRLLRRFEGWRDNLILHKLVPAYGRLLRLMLRYRYISVALAIATLIVSFGLERSKRVEFTFMSRSDSETLVVDLRLPIGTPISVTREYVERIERVAANQPETQSVASDIGEVANVETGTSEAFAPHVAQLFIELKPVEQRDKPSRQVIDTIRADLVGQLDGVDRLSFSEIEGGPSGADISLRVYGKDLEQIDTAITDIKRLLAGFEGVYDIVDDNDLGQVELRFTLKPGAAALGFTIADVAQQVRGFLFGLEAHVFAAQQEDIDVKVRLAEDQRRSLYTIENMWLISPQGKAVPLSEIADVEESTTYATIRRVNRQRAVTVNAATAEHVSPETIVGELRNLATEETVRKLIDQRRESGGSGAVATRINADGDAPADNASSDLTYLEEVRLAAAEKGVSPIDYLRSLYPRLQIKFAGRQEQVGDAFASLPIGFAAAVLMIYIILAWLFSSFTQPLIVLIVVPFATIGVIWGHFLSGYDITFLSVIGFVALSGIVVNDSLILVTFYNAQRAEGKDVFHSLVAAGMARLRAILLTTITTVLGLTPLMLETSFQAKFLIPMAIAISFGLLSATVLVLIVLPCFILVFDDIHAAIYFLWHGEKRPPKQIEPIPEA